MVSKIKSEGYDFAEIIPYILGEDARKIDWKSTAKTGKPHIKVFHEEKEVNVVICTLLSGSLLFKKKKETLFELASILGYMTLKSDNTLTPIMISQEGCYRYTPSKKEHVVAHFIKRLNQTPLIHTTLDNYPIDKEINSLVKRKSLIILLGDFLGDYDFTKLAFKHQIHAIMIRDAFEENPKILGEGTFQDPQSGEEESFYFGRKHVTHMPRAMKRMIKSL